MRRAALALAALVIAGVGLLGGTPGAAKGRREHPNLILVSFDTTRADALSCYGTPPGLPPDPTRRATPTIDALARDGLRFERFYSHAPTTLNAHTSMMSGLDPHGHGVPRNGFPVAGEVTTLAERLREAGYDTIGVVGAKALEAGMGLDRGFRVYDDDTPTKLGAMFQDRAEGVTRRALGHLASHPRGEPLFLFVHFYDPHTPYRAPDPFGERFIDPGYVGPYRGSSNSVGSLRAALRAGTAAPEDLAQVAALYLGEVAYADHHLGVLLEALEAGGFLDRALVVVTADHGEVLSERPAFAYGHGSDVSEGVVRVPLVLRGYGVAIGRGVVERQAAMAGLAPTLEVAMGLAPTLGGGRHFWDLVRPGPVLDRDGWPERSTRTVFLEATRPRKRENREKWNNLPFARGVRAGGFAVRASPVHHEPKEIEGPEVLLPVLGGMLDGWDAGAPEHRTEQLDEETREALEALGYLD